MSLTLRILFFFTFLTIPLFTSSLPSFEVRRGTFVPQEVVIFGAGNIGRGLLAPEIMDEIDAAGNHEWHITFVGYDPTNAKALEDKGSYKVTEEGVGVHKETIITGYDSLSSKDDEALVIKAIAASDLVLTAVGARQVKLLGPIIAKGIRARQNRPPLPVIACENGLETNSDLVSAVLETATSPAEANAIGKAAFFPKSIIDRVIPGSKNYDFDIEAYFSWIVDRQPFEDRGIRDLPNIRAIEYVLQPERYLVRKLYTMNTAHAVAAYYGYEAGYKTIDEAMADPIILAHVEGCLKETAALCVKKYGFSAEDMQNYDNDIVTRIKNPKIKDTVERVGMDPLRKLADRERLTGAAHELADLGLPHEELVQAIAAGAGFVNVVVPGAKPARDEKSFELGDLMKESTPDEVTKQVTGLQPKTPLFESISKGIAGTQARIGHIRAPA